MLLAEERQLLDAVTLDRPWELITTFSTLKREHPNDVRRAAAHIERHLRELGIPVEVHVPELFLSLPGQASVSAGGLTFAAKPMAMSAVFPQGLTAPLVYQPSQYAANADDMFSSALLDGEVDVAGKIVVTEGFGMPGKIRELERRGALGVIAINPGARAHWGICTSIWGTPDLHDLPRKPRVAVANVNRADGDQLIELARSGAPAVMVTELEEGWFPSPVPVVTIPGSEDPEAFVLLHGHYDSWDYGVGDNAVGDATLLEVARNLWNNRAGLRRSVRIAWWPGHSTGRYAGSTWYADHFALELYRNCVAQINCDSPGCRWATEYKDVSVMAEATAWAANIIRDVTGQEMQAERPVRAGDYSFNNIGLSGFFMLLSTMPDDLRAEKGYYAVGGCGGNIAWHTEDDTLDVADRGILLKDIKIYLLSAYRTANQTIIPFDYVQILDEFDQTLAEYGEGTGTAFNLSRAQDAVEALRSDLRELMRAAGSLTGESLTSPQVRRVNAALITLARHLVQVNYTQSPAFFHDPAEHVPPLPDLAVLQTLPGADVSQRGFILTHATRGLNRLLAHLGDARVAVRDALNHLELSVKGGTS
ncbi:M28 family peptidase [Deinococcus sp. Arct2-2]|uniref:M28 family peptidase n=1 Tax=Deinococcus sp. Arct2-2 TaxID=2568653 RepID=UPI0010A587E2|nr:M28 family peptidase [Deinococcus sp. Arct2-2]THF68992.1 M28 family peptidase [Deinococcus sp. Arct2-2]